MVWSDVDYVRGGGRDAEGRGTPQDIIAGREAHEGRGGAGTARGSTADTSPGYVEVIKIAIPPNFRAGADIIEIIGNRQKGLLKSEIRRGEDGQCAHDEQG